MADTAVFSSFHRHRPPAKARVDEPHELDRTSHPVTPVEPGPPARPDPVAAETPANPMLPQEAPPDEPAAEPDVAWADMMGFSPDLDQLGLASPDAIILRAHLRSAFGTVLEVDRSGLYRPPGTRPSSPTPHTFESVAETRLGLVAGTRILTARGEVEVERLVPGDMVMALRGPALRQITWIGQSVQTCWPIRIDQGALGANMPSRPMYVGPDQALFLEPVPVPAHTLVNGTTIRAEERVASLVFLIDVGQADVLLAEGVPVSSGDRVSSPHA